MNRQPFCRPPQWWAPKLSPWCVRISRSYRKRQFHRGQKITNIKCCNMEVVKQAVSEGKGVLITPNHSAHYDAAALYLSADRIDQPLYFMAAWQVFAMANRFERWSMQKLGCFSIDRESNDRQAFKQGINILQKEPYPLVIFPEGDVYHVSDRATPFREGAAAIAISAARKADRPVVTIPCGIKFWYVDDPTEELEELMIRLEERVFLRPQTTRSIQDRVYRLGEGMLALKELDYLGKTSSGTVRERILSLVDSILSGMEKRHDLKKSGSTAPERVKALRQFLIRQLEEKENSGEDHVPALHRDMEDLYFVIQLYSYPGDYLGENPTVEQLAETLDKFEEDILEIGFPTVRSRRRVVLSFGEPIEIDTAANRRDGIAQLTHSMQSSVQSILDGLKASKPA